MRVDTTVVETDVHYPSGTTLLGDGVPVQLASFCRETQNSAENREVIQVFALVFCLTRMCAILHTDGMKEARFESSSDVVRWLQSEAAGLWPALLGSLSFRRSPCVRENCPACMSGEQHPSYVLYGRQKGRRIAVYVPEELVAEVRRGLDNGRALQELLQQAAPRYVKALKRERAKSKNKKS